MKKWIFRLIIPFVLACNTDDNCGEVIDKVIKDNRYLLVIRFDDGASTSQSEFSGALVRAMDPNFYWNDRIFIWLVSISS
mgnify:CR=1 FL=1